MLYCFSDFHSLFCPLVITEGSPKLSTGGAAGIKTCLLFTELTFRGLEDKIITGRKLFMYFERNVNSLIKKKKH